MLTLNAINRVYAVNGGNIDRHQFGLEPRPPELYPQRLIEDETPSEEPVGRENPQPPG